MSQRLRFPLIFLFQQLGKQAFETALLSSSPARFRRHETAQFVLQPHSRVDQTLTREPRIARDHNHSHSDNLTFCHGEVEEKGGELTFAAVWTNGANAKRTDTVK
jgi:hypothetical protein